MTKLRVYMLMFMIGLCFAFLSLLVRFPEETLHSALRGMSIWWDVLFPTLFPFLVLSEILLGFGVVHFFGTLLDPLMRPLFRVPGIGGFVMAMGFASGYPVGAKLTAQLYEQRYVNRTEGERLVAFTSTSDPIFLIGAVAVGFFHSPELALILATAHYGGGVLVGLAMRFYGDPTPSEPPMLRRQANLLMQSIENMHQARLRDGRTFGTLLTDAVQSSLRLVIVIGGLVVFFSVLMELLFSAGILLMLSDYLQGALPAVGLPPQLAEPLINGLFEVTLGTKAAGAAVSVSLIHQVAAAAFVLSWSGLSVHAQIISLINKYGFRYGPFLLARLMHGAAAAILVYVGWPLLAPRDPAPASVPVWAGIRDTFDAGTAWSPSVPMVTLASVLGLALLLSMLIRACGIARKRL